MRVPTKLLASLIIVLCSGVLVGCGGDSQKAGSPDGAADTAQPLVATPLENPDDQVARAAAESLIRQYATKLRAELTAALAAHGTAGAVGVCSEVAPRISTELNGEGWTVRRVSILNRNKNAYPVADEPYFVQQLQQDTTRQPLAAWSALQDMRIFRYFKPIYTEAMCVQCHGPREALAADVVKALDSLYPDDRATGFRVGDLRGAFAVAGNWEFGRARAQKLADQQPPTQ